MKNVLIGLMLVILFAAIAWYALSDSNPTPAGSAANTAQTDADIRQAGRLGDRSGRGSSAAPSGPRIPEGMSYEQFQEMQKRLQVPSIDYVERQGDYDVVQEDVMILAHQYEEEGDLKNAHDTLMPYYQVMDLEQRMYADKILREYTKQEAARVKAEYELKHNKPAP